MKITLQAFKDAEKVLVRKGSMQIERYTVYGFYTANYFYFTDGGKYYKYDK